MTYDETVRYLFGLQNVGIKLGLDNIHTLLEAAGSPQHSFRAVHVAGTNGKGSVSALTASLLRASGQRVGLFTSPHLVHFTERIRVEDAMIPEADVVRLAGRFRAAAEAAGMQPTFFELTTAMAFEYFREQGVGWAVVEVGLGGRLDSTNVIRPEVSVITNIGFDHEQYLGPTIGEIAFEKAGIIKGGVPVVTAARGEALAVIRARAGEVGARVIVLGEQIHVSNVSCQLGRTRMDYQGLSHHLSGVESHLSGRHQAANMALALAACECLGGDVVRFDPATLHAGLRPSWPGRLEILSREPFIVIDGAHNGEAAEVLGQALQDFFPDRPIILVLGMMKDKHLEAVMAPLIRSASRVIVTAPAYGRAARPEELLPLAEKYAPGRAEASADVRGALARACDLDAGRGVILVTGSFYTTGEVKELLEGPGILSRLRE